MDPSLKDLKAEIEYEMKISEKNQKEKILRVQLESENFDFDWDAAATNVDPGESHEVLSIVDWIIYHDVRMIGIKNRWLNDLLL